MNVISRSLLRQAKRITNLPTMTIYVKDKELDKSQYKPSKADQYENYMKNYIHDDPKKEEEKQKILKEIEDDIKAQ